MRVKDEEIEKLHKMIADAEIKEKVGELNAALSDFSDDEKEYAKAEIDAFNADPINSEINSVVNKVLAGIGKKAREDAALEAQRIAEQNAAVSSEDIFSEVNSSTSNSVDENDIF